MKILFTSDDLNLGGAQRQLILLAKNLPNCVERMIWSIEPGVYLSMLEESSIFYIISPRKYRYDIGSLFSLYKIVRKYKPDLIHSWGWMSTLASIPISFIFKIPLVNGIVRSGKPYYYRGKISKFLSKFGDVIVSNNKFSIINWGINPNKSKVIYNGLDINRFSNRDQDFYDHPFTVIMTGRMVKAKDYNFLLQIVRKLVDLGISDWLFYLVGEGEDKYSIIENNLDLIELGIINFPDAGIEVNNLLSLSDVGVLFTNSEFHHEGCSNTILEYMAAGLPVIANNNGGNNEIIDDNITGFLVKEKCFDEVINKLLWLYENSLESKKMGNNGKMKVTNKFSIEKMMTEYINLYEEIIKKK